MTALAPAASPCRIAVEQRRHHHCSREHANLVNSYHRARHAWVLWAEQVSSGYATELAEFKVAHPPVTFKHFLVGLREPRDVAA